MIGVLRTSKKLFHLKASRDNLKPIVSHVDEIFLIKLTLIFQLANATNSSKYPLFSVNFDTRPDPLKHTKLYYQEIQKEII